MLPEPPFTCMLITGEMCSGTTLIANYLNSQSGCVVYSDLLKGWFNETRKLGLPDLSAPLDPLRRTCWSRAW
jgi:hypothetical protein